MSWRERIGPSIKRDDSLRGPLDSIKLHKKVPDFLTFLSTDYDVVIRLPSGELRLSKLGWSVPTGTEILGVTRTAGEGTTIHVGSSSSKIGGKVVEIIVADPQHAKLILEGLSNAGTKAHAQTQNKAWAIPDLSVSQEVRISHDPNLLNNLEFLPQTPSEAFIYFLASVVDPGALLAHFLEARQAYSKKK